MHFTSRKWHGHPTVSNKLGSQAYNLRNEFYQQPCEVGIRSRALERNKAGLTTYLQACETMWGGLSLLVSESLTLEFVR